MESLFLTFILLIVWFIFDAWIVQHLELLQESKLSDMHQALETPYPLRWNHKRYQILQKLRWLGIGILFVNQKELFFSLWLVLLILAFKWPYWRLIWQHQKKLSQVRYLFPIYLRQLQVLLQNNTVVKAIEASQESVPALFKKDIEALYRSLSEDPMRLESYLMCLSQYHLPEIQRAMKWLYRYQSIGHEDAYRQFNRMIGSTSKWLRQTRLESKSESIQIYQWLGMLPLFGVTLVFLSAMMSLSLSFFERG